MSDINYRMMKPDDPGNIQCLSEGHAPSYRPVSARTFAGSVTIDGKEYAFAQTALATTVELVGLKVTGGRGRADEPGELTLYCRSDNTEVQLRTEALTDANGEPVTVDTFLNKTLTVRGVVDCFNGTYQVKVFSMDAITMSE